MKINLSKSMITLAIHFLILSLCSCSGDADIIETPKTDNLANNTKTSASTTSAAVAMLNVAYGEHPEQVMDIYLQENRTLQTPLIILVHGGGWVAGDKADADFMKDACYYHGMNVVNINYRLANENINYLHIMSDIDAAIAMILAYAEDYNVRTSKIVMWGGSAGGHLSLLYAYNHDIRNVISLVITLGAPTRFDSQALILSYGFNGVGVLATLTGKPFDAFWPLDPAYTDASPYHGENLKPTLLIHGELDTIVRKSQAEMMGQKLTEANVDNIVFILPNGGHAGENTTPEASDQANQLMYQAVLHYSN